MGCHRDHYDHRDQTRGRMANMRKYDEFGEGEVSPDDRERPSRRTIPCRSCQHGMTWREIRATHQWLTRQGLMREQAKEILPRCQQCAGKIVNTFEQFAAT